jgi:Caspase domain
MTWAFPAKVFAVCIYLSLLPHAEVHRMGLFIGNDRGLKSESELKYASRDAQEMSKIFRQTGLYQQADLILLTNTSLDQVQASMATIESSAQKRRKQGLQTQLFVYFSGHGDAQSLHIHGQKLNRDELVTWLNNLPCELKIVVLDACESGDFLRSKGGSFLQDLPVQIENNLKSRGSIIVSSTSRGELAQESDEYRGAVFTHHLANGLRGLADYNGDGWIGLQESFEYSRRATSMDMALQGSLRQNPSFDLDLVGGSDPGLVPLDRGKSWMLLRNFPSGTLDIYNANSLDRASSVWLSGSDSLAYRIQSGSYLFRFREGGREFVLNEIISKNGGVSIDRKRFQEKVRWSWVSKGGSSIRLNGMQASFGSPHPFANTSMQMSRVDQITRRAGSKRVLSFGVAKGRSENQIVGLSNDLVLYHLGASQLYFLGGSRRLRLSSGGLVAFNLVRQSLLDHRFAGEPVETTEGPKPVNSIKWANVYQLGLPFDLEWAVFGRFWIAAEARYSLYGFKDAGPNKFKVRLELEPFVNFGLHF